MEFTKQQAQDLYNRLNQNHCVIDEVATILKNSFGEDEIYTLLKNELEKNEILLKEVEGSQQETIPVEKL